MRCAAPAVRAFALGLLVGPAAAQEDTVYVTGSRLPVSAPALGQEARIVERDVMRAAPSLPDALRGLSELHADPPRGFASLYLRGADPNHTAVFLDGVKVNDPTNPRGGGFDLGMIDVQALDRLEVLAGASSAIYGADAMAGVLGLVSAPPRGSGLRVGAGIGGLGYRSANASYDAQKARISASTLEDGEGEAGERRIRMLSLRAPQLALHAWRHESAAFPEDSGGPRHAVLRELERRDTTSFAGSAQAQMSAGAATVRARLGLFDQESDSASPGVAAGIRDPAGLPPVLSTSRFNRWSASATAELGPGLAGVEWQREDGSLESSLSFGGVAVPANFSLERETRSIFMEARRAFLQAGLRLDDVEGYARRASALLGLTHTLANGAALALRAGSGFKPPSFFALGHPLVGNPALQPERSTSTEASIATPEQASIRHRVTAFRSDYSNLIDFDAGPPPRLVNRSEVRIEGLHYLAQSRYASLGASRFRYELPEGAGPLRSRPRSKVTGSVNAPLSEEFSFLASGARVGRVFDSSIPTGGQVLDPYFVVDLALRYRARRREALLALDNVFDRDYEQFIGFPAPGRRLRLAVSFAL